MVHIAGVSGSLRNGSHTRLAVRTALESAEREGTETNHVGLREYDLPVFDPNDEDAGDGPRLRQEVRDADVVILGTPMYHGS